MQDVQKRSIAIIGAGMAGVAAACTLREAGHRVVVFEKSRGWGGRCATKRWEGQIVDHGAQYFSVRNPDFRAALDAAVGPKLGTITAPIFTETGDVLPPDGRFFHSEGNSRLARDLGAGLEVRTEARIGAVDGLRIEGEEFDAVVSTAPMPQTLALCGRDEPDVYYAACLSAVFLYEGPLDGLAAARYALSDRSGDPLAWSACENHKAGRITPDRIAIVAQASEEFSTMYLDEEAAAWEPLLRDMVEERWEIASNRLRASFAHRWRFARVEPIAEDPSLPDGWFFAGDALTGPRVESAWTAGRMVGRRVASAFA